MRSIISLLAFFFSVSIAISQRVSFDDPDLTFSFKKPKDWQLFDDGYYVKLSPSVEDTAHTYFTITYFETPKPIGSYNEVPQAELTDQTTSQPSDKKKVKIGQYHLSTWTSSFDLKDQSCLLRKYQFDHLGQSWEIVTSSPKSNTQKLDKLYKRIIKSLRIEQ